MSINGAKEVGFIGLGMIGLPAATNLIKAGFEVVGFSLDNLKAFASAGGIVARSAADVAEKCDVILQCPPVATSLEFAVYGADGILKTLLQLPVKWKCKFDPHGKLVGFA